MGRVHLAGVVCAGAVVALALTGCSTDDLTAASSCEQFLKAPTDAQNEAVKQVALDKHAADAVTPAGRPNVDYMCVKNPKMTLGDAVALAGGSSSPAATQTAVTAPTGQDGAALPPGTALPTATMLPGWNDADLKSRLFHDNEVGTYSAADMNKVNMLTRKPNRVLTATGCQTEVLAALQPDDEHAWGQFYGTKTQPDGSPYPDGRPRRLILTITRIDTHDPHQVFARLVAVRDQCTSYGDSVFTDLHYTVSSRSYRHVGQESAAWTSQATSTNPSAYKNPPTTVVAFRSGQYIVYLSAYDDIIDRAVDVAERHVAH